MPEFNSENWFPQLEIIAKKFYDCSDKKFVTFRETSIAVIKEAYPVRVASVKREIFDDDDIVGKKIDHHKIIALYIQLFLENPVFVLQNKGANPHPAPATMLINEMFCLRIMCIVIKKWSNKIFDEENFRKYRKWFFRLLDNYREHSEFHKRNALFTCSLAHLIYFIERVFFVDAEGPVSALK